MYFLVDRLWYDWRENVGNDLVTDDDYCGAYYTLPVVDPQVSELARRSCKFDL
jgi:hypothetical protein